MKNRTWYPVFALAVICLAVSLLVSAANAMTGSAVKRQEELALAESRRAVLDADEYIPVPGYDCVRAVKDGSTAGYVFSEKSKGYGGEITVLVGMDTAGRITGVRVNSHSETPGLGARYAADGALSGYNGLGSGVADDTVRLTGASVTGRAISECVNAAFDAFAEITEGR